MRLGLMLLLLAGVIVVPTAHAQTPPTSAPAALVPANAVYVFESLGRGVQIYRCEANATAPPMHAWVFVAPEATLYNAAGQVIGTHFGGPTWQGNDGSTVVGMVAEQQDSPESSAIPWLLLRAQSNGGSGLFSSVTYIQRLDTAGGVAPADGCGAGTVGETQRVPYTSNYVFWYAAGQQ
jgi:hypothetical protein